MDHTAASSISVVQWEAKKIVFDSFCTEMQEKAPVAPFSPQLALLVPYVPLPSPPKPVSFAFQHSISSKAYVVLKQ